MPPTAHYTVSGRGGGRSNRGGNGGRGRFAQGHRGGGYTQFSTAGRCILSTHSNSANLQCYNCNCYGHMSRQCPSPCSSPYAHVAQTNTISSAWIVDLSANYHLISNLKHLVNSIPLTDNNALTIADGNCNTPASPACPICLC